MLTYGWIESEIKIAAARASDLIGTPVYCKDVTIKSENCKIGGHTINFVLRPQSGRSARRRDGYYPPGIKVSFQGGKARSSGALCFHAFGHFMRAMFEMNPAGRIKTGLADYVGAEGFEDQYPRVGLKNVGSMINPIQHSEACECMLYDVEKF